jgi:hypothetical protein
MGRQSTFSTSKVPSVHLRDLQYLDLASPIENYLPLASPSENYLATIYLHYVFWWRYSTMGRQCSYQLLSRGPSVPQSSEPQQTLFTSSEPQRELFGHHIFTICLLVAVQHHG